MPRIKNWKHLKFFKPSVDENYQYINELFTREPVNWELILRHLPDMFQVVQSIKAGRIKPSTILRKLSTASRKNKLYYAFRELGRVVRTAFLLEYLSDEKLRRAIQGATNKCEGFNKLAKWVYFASNSIQENVRDEQIKIIKYNQLIANLIILHNVQLMIKALQAIQQEESIEFNEELLNRLSPYKTSHILRFGTYEFKERNAGKLEFDLNFLKKRHELD